jgi:hypothetical protein
VFPDVYKAAKVAEKAFAEVVAAKEEEEEEESFRAPGYASAQNASAQASSEEG